MALTEAQAELGSGGIAAGGSFIAGILNYFSQKDTNKQNYQIYQEQRADEKATQKANEKLAKANLALNTRAQAFSEAEAAKNRTEATEQKGYGRLQNAYQRGADLFTQSMNLLQTKAAPFQKYAASR